MLVEQREHPLRARLAGRARLADDDGRHATDGGKGRQQVRREAPVAYEDVRGEERVVTELRELGRWARMAEEELALRGDEQDGERRRRPGGPDLVADRRSEMECFGDADPVVGCQPNGGGR